MKPGLKLIVFVLFAGLLIQLSCKNAVSGNKIFLAGGSAGYNKTISFGGSASFDIYDLTSNSWSIGMLPQNLKRSSIISYNNILYMAGRELNRIVPNHVFILEF